MCVCVCLCVWQKLCGFPRLAPNPQHVLSDRQSCDKCDETGEQQGTAVSYQNYLQHYGSRKIIHDLARGTGFMQADPCPVPVAIPKRHVLWR